MNHEPNGPGPAGLGAERAAPVELPAAVPDLELIPRLLELLQTAGQG